MKCRLRSYQLAPPGGYPYYQTEGIKRKFPSQPLIEAQASIVSGFRKANGLPRSSVLESLADIDHYTCARLGCMASFCIPLAAEAQQQHSMSPTHPLVTPCGSCGAPVQ